jgi:hypothetical protein
MAHAPVAAADDTTGLYAAAVTVRLAGDDPQTMCAASIGEAWLAVAGR